jgi:hypothetical protein
MLFPVQLVAVHATAASTTGTPVSRPASTTPPEELLLPAPELLLLPAPLLELLLLPAPELELELLPAPELELLPAPPSSPGLSPGGFTSPPQPAARTLTRQAEPTDAASKAIRMTLPLFLVLVDSLFPAIVAASARGLRHVRLDILARALSARRLQSIAKRE